MRSLPRPLRAGLGFARENKKNVMRKNVLFPSLEGPGKNNKRISVWRSAGLRTHRQTAYLLAQLPGP